MTRVTQVPAASTGKSAVAPRVLIFSQHDTSRIKALLRKNSIPVVTRDPDAIICYGGDGTYLLAEHNHPGVPKAIVRKSEVKRKSLTPAQAITALKRWPSRTEERMKLDVTVKKARGRAIKLVPAANDVIIRNERQLRALRFNIYVDGRKVTTDEIGDGVVISTPAGSGGYYQSITRQTFSCGIGIAFNNIVRSRAALITAEDSVIEVHIRRSVALLSSDVEPLTRLDAGDSVIIRRSAQKARIILP
jgi:NAD kinase